MDTMPMPGGTMSMAWVPMCGQSWMGAAASFLGMWTVMMAAMMLPSLIPRLWRYRQDLAGAGGPASVLLTVVVAGGYFLVWTLIGAAIYSFGAATMAVTMRYPVLANAVPIAIGLVVLSAGLLQFTGWKAHHLARCRNDCGRASLRCGNASPVTPFTAWRDGLRLGLHCSQCCAGLTAAFLVAGIMDWPVMLAVTVAINLERLAPAGERVAQLIGTVVIGAGLLVVVRAAAGL
jgi:predicted metal-binding membrane protein